MRFHKDITGPENQGGITKTSLGDSADDTTAKPKQKRRYTLDERKTEETLHSGNTKDAHSNTPGRTSTIHAENNHLNAPVGGTHAVGNGGNGAGEISGLSSNLAKLQHSTAGAIRNLMPDETPDRNAGVSAVRFGMEIAATTASITVDPKRKKKSKMQHDKSRLQFEGDDENRTDNANADTKSADENENSTSEHDGSGSEQPGSNADSNIENNAYSDDSPNNSSDTSNDGTADTAENKDASADTTSTDKSTTAEPTDTKPPPKDSSRSPGTDSGEADGGADSSDTGTDGKLRFSKEENQIVKLEKKADKYGRKLDKAKSKLPTKKVKKKQLVFDENKKKNVTKLTHEKEVIPIGEAKCNKQKEKSVPVKIAGAGTSMAVTKIHAKIHQVEHENVGIKAAHQAELLGESTYRGAKKGARTAYRFHKNRPYRRVSKLEQKSIKNKMKLDYKKALRDNPKLKSNPLSRFMQKRAIKRNYAKDLRAAKNAAQTGKKAVGITAKAAKVVTAIIRKNPVFLIKLIIIGLLFFLIMSLFTMCAAIFSGGNAFIGAVTYPAEAEYIDDASVLMTELETDLRIYIEDIEVNHPGFDEYIFNIGSIGHNPFELIAFLSAVYQDFTFAEVEATIRDIFDEMYTLSLVSEVEIRTGTGTGTDPETGESYTYTYEYEWHILHVTLTSQSFMDVITPRMDEEQTQHFHVLMYSHGARQFIGNPFAFDWMPFVTSLYGYRVHPINGGKQFHFGIDIGLPIGTEILATFDGFVVSVAYQPSGYGNIVVIENEDGVQARFAHCHEIFVVAGQEVTKGDVIATVGSTGASTGPHLHLEVAWDGRRFNPLFFVEFRN